MKNKNLLKVVFLLGYILSIIVMFLINKESLDSTFRYLAVIIGVVAFIYFIPFSLIQSIRKRRQLRDI